jgi:hypothetical protein
MDAKFAICAVYTNTDVETRSGTRENLEEDLWVWWRIPE